LCTLLVEFMEIEKRVTDEKSNWGNHHTGFNDMLHECRRQCKYYHGYD